MAGTGVGKFSSTAGSNTSNLTVNFAENMAPSNVNNAARELMGHIRDMYEQLGDGYFEFGDGDGEYTVARSDADTITITSSSDISSVYFAGRKIRITDGGANVVEGTIASSSHTSTTQTVNLTGISLASGTPTKVELGVDTAAFGGRVILDDDGDTYIEAPTDDTIDIYVAGAKDFSFTANTFTAHSGSNVDLDGDLDVDGTTNLDVVDIDGAVNMATTALVTGVLTTTAATVFNGGFASNAASTITVTDTSNNLSLVSTDASSASAPNLIFYRNSASPATDDFLGKMVFRGENSNDDTHDYFTVLSRIKNKTDGSEQSDLIFKDATGNNIVNFAHSEVAFNDDSIDRDFRVESNSYTHCLFVDGGNDRVGIGESTDIGGLFRVSLGDSGVTSVNSAGQALVIEDNANTGLTIATPTDGTGAICFADSGDNDRGRIAYDHSNDRLFIDTNGNDAPCFFFNNGSFATNGESAPDVDQGGLCLDQNAGDDKIMSFKSSDVAHSMTTRAEADTYGFIQKAGSNDGGLQINGLNDAGNVALQIRGLSNGGEDTGKGTGDHGCIRIDATSRTGTTSGTQGANVNMVTICNNNTVRFIFDAEGDFHADSSSTTFDTYEDAQLVRAYDLSHGKGVISSKFDKFVQYNASDLTDAGLVGKVNNEYNEDGTKANPLINMSGFMRLHNGAIWQQYEKTERLANAMYELAKAAVGEDKANEILKQNEIKLLN